eukprot:TRINITY_DN5053_c0_g1_i2.p1 TRINITY_DN5053_c0_g1~~TRINITY_DN5053_c0_g1_i2.p1  ORF type:complete len:366 (+),score=56.19 TRINITY_DN5053_c0_g1_i2:101-1198(+)
MAALREVLDELSASDPTTASAEERLSFARRLTRVLSAKYTPSQGQDASNCEKLMSYSGAQVHAEDCYHSDEYSSSLESGGAYSFASYVWSTPEGIAEDEIGKLRVLALWLDQMSRPSVRYWLDRVSSPQAPDLVETLGKWGFFFQEYLALSSSMIVILSPNYLSRLWCIYELAAFLTMKDTSKLFIPMTPWLMKVEQPTEKYIGAIRGLSLPALQCSRESDRKFLLSMVDANFTSVEAFERYAKMCLIGAIGKGLIMDLHANSAAGMNFDLQGKLVETLEALCALAIELGMAEIEKGMRAMGKPAYVFKNPMTPGYVEELSDVFAKRFNEEALPFLTSERTAALKPDSPFLQLSKLTEEMNQLKL